MSVKHTQQIACLKCKKKVSLNFMAASIPCWIQG